MRSKNQQFLSSGSIAQVADPGLTKGFNSIQKSVYFNRQFRSGITLSQCSIPAFECSAVYFVNFGEFKGNSVVV